MQTLAPSQEKCLRRLLAALIDQQAARIIVAPNEAASGFWFGGGSMVQDEQGALWLSGRYRNYGDSRTGLVAGERGLECAVFRLGDGGDRFIKAHSWSKAELSCAGREVLSIEGTALHQRADGVWELYISSEKEMAYPAGLESYQKPGTGVWTIDVMRGPTLDELDPATLAPVLENHDVPGYLHVKDPVLDVGEDGHTRLIFCTHPFSWASANTGLALRKEVAAAFTLSTWEMVTRGPSWDVASTRVTDRLVVPALGCFAGLSSSSVYLYDGAESMRPLEENSRAHSRPRGYSCEELGGAFLGWDEAFPAMTRISSLGPLFLSPWGSRSSRYVKTLTTATGVWALWQQSQPDFSQPLVANFLPMEEVERLLSVD